MKYLALSIDGMTGKIGTDNPPVPSGGLDTILKAIPVAIGVIFVFAIIAALFLLIFSGFMWITSAGDKQKLQQSKQRLIYVLVGLVVIFLSFFVVNLIAGFFGINVFNIPTSTPSL